MHSAPPFLRDNQGNVFFENFLIQSCRRLIPVKNINALNRKSAVWGYEVYEKNPAFLCNYAFGETLLIGLYKSVVLGAEPFRAAWKEIYELSVSVDRLVTDVEIYEIFLRHAPEDKIGRLKEIFQEWHGGNFPE